MVLRGVRLAVVSALGSAVVAAQSTREGAGLPDAAAFHEQVLAVIASYPTDGSHRYLWPRPGQPEPKDGEEPAPPAGWIGNTRDLRYAGERLAPGDPLGRCYCSGLTFEVFVRAWQAWCAASEREFAIPGLAGVRELRRLQRQWFGDAEHVRCSDEALVANGLGYTVDHADARPGDFVQLWRHSGSGHSAVFLGWVRDEHGDVVGLRYWSTQKATDGIGEREERFGTDRGVDRTRTWITRVGAAPPNAKAKGDARGGRR